MSQSIDLMCRVVASREQVSCELEDEAVILNVRSGEYFGLDPVGARIWELVQESRTVAEIRDAILRDFPDAEPEQCTGDLLEFLDQLAGSGLVEIRAVDAA